MKDSDVVMYLQDNPKFFEANLETLLLLSLPHPHGGRTISLGERQMLALRDKNKDLEKNLHNMIEFARENEILQGKVHDFIIALFAARDLNTLLEMIPHLMQDIFAVPHTALRLWQIAPPSAELLAFTDEHTQPVCMHQNVHGTAEWFGESAAQLHSFAYLPLRAGSVSVGLLIVASEDKKRFYPEMGTVFLQRLAEAVESALHPYLNQE